MYEKITVTMTFSAQFMHAYMQALCVFLEHSVGN